YNFKGTIHALSCQIWAKMMCWQTDPPPFSAYNRYSIGAALIDGKEPFRRQGNIQHKTWHGGFPLDQRSNIATTTYKRIFSLSGVIASLCRSAITRSRRENTPGLPHSAIIPTTPFVMITLPEPLPSVTSRIARFAQHLGLAGLSPRTAFKQASQLHLPFSPL